MCATSPMSRFITDTSDALVSNVTRNGSGIVRTPAVTLAIAKRAGSNAVVVAEAILKRVEQLKGPLDPADIVVEVTRNYGETANEKANELLFHLGLATVSIILLVWLTIGWREAMVVAIVIPVTILLTLLPPYHGLHAEPRLAVRPDLLDRHPGRRRDRRHRKHLPALGDARRARPSRPRSGRGGSRQPDHRRHPDVVAALLPMLFVSGMMGPYMSPIPANASAAMIFSLFVAVIVTPWLMLKVAGRRRFTSMTIMQTAPCSASAYAAVARPILSSKRCELGLPARRRVLTLGSLVAVLHRARHRQAAAFRQQVRTVGHDRLPEGSSVEATDAVAQDVARIVLDLTEVNPSRPMPVPPPPSTSTGWCAIPSTGSSRSRATSRSTCAEGRARPHEPCDSARHPQAHRGHQRPPGISLKVVEPPPGPPVMATLLAEIYGPDADTRRKVAEKVEAAFRSVPFIVDIEDSYGVEARGCGPSISTDDLDFFRVQESDVFDTIAILSGGRRSAIRIAARAASRSRSASSGRRASARWTSGS